MGRLPGADRRRRREGRPLPDAFAFWPGEDPKRQTRRFGEEVVSVVREAAEAERSYHGLQVDTADKVKEGSSWTISETVQRGRSSKTT
jgi:hypothetical protein